MRKTLAGLAIGATTLVAAPTASAEAQPGCRAFGQAVANVQELYPKPEHPFGETVSFFAHLRNGDPLRLDRWFYCTYGT